MEIKKNLIHWSLVLAYAAMIFYFSSLPAAPAIPLTKSGIGLSSNIEHIAEYFILSFLLLRASLKSGFRYPFLFAVSISVLYGISDEFHQLFVSGRNASSLDVVFDAVGSLLVILLMRVKDKIHRL